MNGNRLQIVIDTNVIYAALRSPTGASNLVLRMVGGELFDIHLSVPLILEYESIAKRYLAQLAVTLTDIDDVIDYLCQIGIGHQIYYSWRPFLPDRGDEMLLELAVTAGCDAIVTFNKKDFRGIERFSIQLLTPVELLVQLGAI